MRKYKQKHTAKAENRIVFGWVSFVFQGISVCHHKKSLAYNVFCIQRCAQKFNLSDVYKHFDNTFTYIIGYMYVSRLSSQEEMASIVALELGEMSVKAETTVQVCDSKCLRLKLLDIFHRFLWRYFFDDCRYFFDETSRHFPSVSSNEARYLWRYVGTISSNVCGNTTRWD